MGEVLFEICRLGAYAKAAAVDAETGIEATVIGPARTPDAQLRELALRKLRMVMTKQRKEG